MAVFEDGADFDGERLAAVLALVSADAGGLALELRHTVMRSAALRADWTIGPKPSFDPFVGFFFVVEALV